MCEWVNVLHSPCKAPWIKAIYKCLIYHMSVRWLQIGNSFSSVDLTFILFTITSGFKSKVYTPLYRTLTHGGWLEELEGFVYVSIMSVSGSVSYGPLWSPAKT